MKQVCSQPHGVWWARLLWKSENYFPGPRTPNMLGALCQAVMPMYLWTLPPLTISHCHTNSWFWLPDPTFVCGLTDLTK